MIARQAGIGNIIFVSLDLGIYNRVYAMIVIIGALGFILDVIFEFMRGRLVAWAEPAQTIVAGST
jgi:NitT/TauT family transport system permease protein